MQKFINMWFEAEQMALDFSQTKFYEVGVKVLKTVILFLICLFQYFLILISDSLCESHLELVSIL